MPENIGFTHGQFHILLNKLSDWDDDRAASLQHALLQCAFRGNRWQVALTQQDMEAAFDIFNAHQARVRTPAASQALRLFARASPTVEKLYRAQQANVPRETSTEGTT